MGRRREIISGMGGLDDPSRTDDSCEDRRADGAYWVGHGSDSWSTGIYAPENRNPDTQMEINPGMTRRIKQNTQVED